MDTIDLRLEGKAKVCIKGSARFFGLMMRVGGGGVGGSPVGILRAEFAAEF